MSPESVLVEDERLAEDSFPEVEKQYVREKAYPKFDWVAFAEPSPVNLLDKPVSQCTVALVTTAGVHVKTDPPFNLRSAIGDHTYREIPNGVSLDDLRLSHIGYDIKRVSADKNCVFPLDRLRELPAQGVIGAVAPRHFSFMGYVAETDPLTKETAPEVAEKLKADRVDLVLLAPA